MKSFRVFAPSVLLLAVIVPRGVGGRDGREDRAVDEGAIRRALAAYVETWNRHDMGGGRTGRT